ncbi:PIN domain-containing protein [Burkholderia pseudomallei]|uniref:PIN domain-containing protein n=1 Tax=Burkholderia pseudomallei TaxID=28450 RepID=UPI0035A87B59
MLLRNLSDRRLVRLAQDGDHLFFGKPALLHDFLFSVGSHSLKFQLVRKFQGRSPPFREGKKRKEFPDAFAISMVDTYADKNRCFVAVVSDDQDFKLACERFPNLLYFKSLPRLTERLLPAEDDVEKLHAAIDADIDELLNAVSLEIEGLNFHHYDRRFELDESNISVPSIHDLSIVAIGESECTVTFEVEIEAQHKLQWDEYNGPDERPDRLDGWILETVNVEGTAKLSFDPKTNALTGVPYVCLDAEDIEVSATPRRW